jgi:hypothetical protein
VGRFQKWLARKTSVGGTARWAVAMYRSVRESYPSLSGPAVYRMMLAKRYMVLPNPTQQEYLGNRAFEVDGLMGLVIEILKVEFALADNEVDPLMDCLQVIGEELEKGHLSKEEIFGRKRNIWDFLDQARSKPSVKERGLLP